MIMMTEPSGRANIISRARRIVIKLGSSVVTNETGIDFDFVEGLVEDICGLREKGKEFIIVSSGAIAAGAKKMELKQGARTIPQKQAAAAIGQTELMSAYENAFDKKGIRVAQMLLTKDDLSHRRRHLNAKNTLTTLMAWKVVPIINENDTVMVEEIQLGDNDNLSALVATMADADLLMALTDMEGLMDCDPRISPEACLIPVVETLDENIRRLAGTSKSTSGTGGMSSKLDAASKAGIAGIPMIIAGGKTPHVVKRIIEGADYGTLILPPKSRMSAKKHWILFNLEPEGVVVVDDGAERALVAKGKSLLPIGVVQVSGDFEHGAAVAIQNLRGKTIAMGLVNYSSHEIAKIKGRKSPEIDWILGYRRNDEITHADNLALSSNGAK
jgi:glutamate 5-kinase